MRTLAARSPWTRNATAQLQLRRVQYIATVTRYWDHSLALSLTPAEVSVELQYHCYVMSNAVYCLPGACRWLSWLVWLLHGF